MTAPRLFVDGRVLDAAPHPTGVERVLRTLLLGLDERGVAVTVGRKSVPRLRARAAGADVWFSPVAAVPPLGPLPRVATIHDLPWVDGAPRERRTRRDRLRTALTIRTASAFVVPSEATADALRSAGAAADRIVVAPPGLDPIWRTAPAAAGPVPGRLIHVGAPRRRKAIATLLAAFASVRATRPVELVLVGPGTETVRAEGVRALGFVPDDVLVDLVDGAALFVSASVYEGFGLPPLEAQARGVPVVAVWSRAAEETLGESAILVPPHDADALAAAIARGLDDASWRERVRAAGRERVSALTPRAQAEGVLEACSRALRGRLTP